uniref:Uncharacterized protein n=1 Tax=Anguilla anguilla TaxID=7936 RepID=A0A0E9U434_ANGAN
MPPIGQRFNSPGDSGLNQSLIGEEECKPAALLASRARFECVPGAAP